MINFDNFVKPSDPILSNIAEEIPPDEITSPSTKAMIKDMLSVAYGEQVDKGKPLLVGLAAPQIGISKRIILVDTAADGKGNIGNLQVFINPEISWMSEEEEEWYEGCFSTDHVCGVVARAVKIRVKALNEAGERIEQGYEGYTARIFQHEIDHLNGKEFVTHIIDDANLHWVEDNEFSDYRNNESWRHWEKKCLRAKWMQIKGLV